MGALGVSAVWIGSALLGLQKSAWIALGALYALLGILYLSGQGYRLTSAIAPRLSRLCSPGGSAALGVLFAFNIPACAGPLLLALLGMTAAGGASGAPPAAGFVSLALFGLALSLPLVTAVLW